MESLSWWAFCGVLPGHVVLAPKVLVRALEREEMCGSRSQVVCEYSRKAEASSHSETETAVMRAVALCVSGWTAVNPIGMFLCIGSVVQLYVHACSLCAACDGGLPSRDKKHT